MSKKNITFEEFCALKGVSAVLPEITGISEKVKNQMLATYQWEFIVKTLNDEGQEKEWEPDYANEYEQKWELWVEFSPASGWSLVDVDSWSSHTFCGSRRVFRTREIARYAGTELLHFYIATF
ncbi:hypothetical protein [Flavobacterium sp. N1994]|uniref:hypothetical protein n=1 Tax=Flavobacterium sp. N1994 TaxID=2986827 RepID=UPI0022214705|nr:hypothetical protein [Flavobacterium sp. N1994]